MPKKTCNLCIDVDKPDDALTRRAYRIIESASSADKVRRVVGCSESEPASD